MLSSQDIRRFQKRLEAQRDAIEARIDANKQGIQETIVEESGVGDREDEASLLYEREAEIWMKMLGIGRNWRRWRGRSAVLNKEPTESVKFPASPSQSIDWRLPRMQQRLSVSTQSNANRPAIKSVDNLA
jgi:hypothetical protein